MPTKQVIPMQIKGPVAWMAGHSVAANLAMAVLVLGGLLSLQHIRQEVFPNFEIDAVTISVAYPGASPEEVENGIILALEDVISGVENIHDIESVASEGLGTVTVNALRGADLQRLALDIQKEVDRITTFPIDAEQPIVKIVSGLRPLLEVVLYGDTKDLVLHELAEHLRDRLLQDPNISQAELNGVKPMEISIDVSQENLRRYQLSLGEIAQRVARASIDLPTGSIKTQSGEILIRMKERKDFGLQFAHLPIVTTADGSQVFLADIANIKDGYDQSDYYAVYDGKPAVMIQLYNIGEQTPIAVSESVTGILESFKPELPDGITVKIRRDSSDDYRQRIDLLLRNSAMGLALVLITLAVFLELRLAFWVMTGIPIAFLGSFLILPSLGVTLNMVSLFAFIIALGIVVDDAIIIGENIYHYLQEGLKPMDAAIKGARDMAIPVTFSILTNIAAFMPILFIPGVTGKMFTMIPLVVITVFLLSLLESLFILPNHLSHVKKPRQNGIEAWIHHYQQRFSSSFRHWVAFRYGGFLDWTLHHRHLIVVAAFALLVSTLSYVGSGRVGITAFPKTEADFARVSVTMPFGTPVAITEATVQKLTAAAYRVAESIPNGNQLLIGVFAELGSSQPGVIAGGHIANVRAYLAPPDIREKIMSTDQFARLWRKEAGDIVGAESIVFESDFGGPGAGAAITVELNHRDSGVLAAASAQLVELLRSYPAAINVRNEFSAGKEQLDFTLLPEARSLGLDAQDVASQVRNAFYGAEVLRQQRGRNELKVMVRLPESERISMHNIDTLLLWNSAKKEIPLKEAVHVERGRAFTRINRRDGRRIIRVTADVGPNGRVGDIVNDLKTRELPQLMNQYPGLSYSFQGKQAEMADSMGSLKISFVLALCAIYAMLAIPFKSYTLPLIVIITIPFAAIGAVFGHMLMGYDLSIISILGMVALSGIVINDSLVLIDYAKELKYNSSDSAFSIIRTAAIQRFRPIVLTSLTTFFGVMPMILETSKQARFLIPMAISIGFGILFATVITLILIPSLYLLIDDIGFALKRHRERDSSAAPHTDEAVEDRT
ncbi:MAG: AcrB/AcrD/AcrF family protein [Gammaproteobacteria bacterium HGW-Gammaproteobacteria-3]|nr:MAG: AcrB/AcrD/AcrF family protein [Gammaproteobacteria bacterium HGW-Gammaproteobacteria-3]